MSVLGRALGIESRATLRQPSGWLGETLGATPAYSGKSVTPASGLELVPVYAAVSRLSGTVGSLPLIVYRRGEAGRERATSHWMWRLLHDQPNPQMAADELWELVMCHLLLWGNAFVEKVKNDGVVTQLWPIRPSRVQVDFVDGEKVFWVDNETRLTEADVLHIRGLGTDGVVGLSPIQQARQTLGSIAAMEEFTGSFWANDAAPGVILRHPNRLSPEAAQRLKATWDSARSKKHGTAVVEENIAVERLTMPLEDAQFLDTAKFNDLKVCQLFGLSPHVLGASSGDSMTYANTEMQGIDFVRWSLRRWLVRIERSLYRDQDLFIQGSRFYAEFLVEALLRGDSKGRAEFYTAALNPQTGWMTREEVRDAENLNPLPPEAFVQPQPAIPVVTDG